MMAREKVTWECDDCKIDGIVCELKTSGEEPTYCPAGGDKMDENGWEKVSPKTESEVT